MISGNGSSGVYVTGSGATGNQVQGNYLGTDAAGTGDLGNSGYGVYVYNVGGNTIYSTQFAGGPAGQKILLCRPHVSP